MNIWTHKCKECENLIDFEGCPYCREIKKRESDDGRKEIYRTY